MLIDAAAVINTCAMKPGAPPQYAQRVDWVRKSVDTLRDLGFQQVIVAGDFEPGKNYTYVPVGQQYHNCRDVLKQRQAGYDSVVGYPEHIWFQMDDMQLISASFETIHGVDVVSPVRVSSKTGEELNSGWNGIGYKDPVGPYIHTHAMLMSQKALLEAPWSLVSPIYRFDIVHYWLMQDRNLALSGNREWVIQDMGE